MFKHDSADRFDHFLHKGKTVRIDTFMFIREKIEWKKTENMWLASTYSNSDL